jgi:hypothetical protein
MFSALTDDATNSPRKKAMNTQSRLNAGSSALRRGIDIHHPLPYLPARWR